MGGTNENGRVASPESVSIHLKFGHNNRHNTSLKLSIQSSSYSYQMDIFLLIFACCKTMQPHTFATKTYFVYTFAITEYVYLQADLGFHW